MSEEISKIEKKRIGILGCGWLGFPLAQRLQLDPITSFVNGSTTSESKIAQFENAGIKPFLLDLTPGFETDSESLQSFFDVDSLLISLPPRAGKNGAGFYPLQMQAVVEEIQKSSIKEVIFISSTGIYPELNRLVTEEDVRFPNESALPDMVTAENLIESLRPERKVTILRLSGLLGYNRIPGKYVQGQKEMTTGSIPVNYIHRDDAVNMILMLLKSDLQDTTLNIVAPLHPTRREVYERSCAQFGWEAPTFAINSSEPDFKVISGEKFNAHYSYDFKFPDPLTFYYSLNDEIRRE